MATKTYLQIVNNVLGRLREDPVTAVSSTTYSTLIGIWVNDAKTMVENAWDWQALRTSVAVPVLASTVSYTISSLNERCRLIRDLENPNLPLAFDITTTTNPYQLIDAPADWITKQYNLLTTPNNQEKPTFFGLVKSPTSIMVSLYETPTIPRSWILYFIDPQDDLSSDGDILLTPAALVSQIALLYALNERGEEIGEPGTTVDQKARTFIADAIAIDAKDQTHLTTFYPN